MGEVQFLMNNARMKILRLPQFLDDARLLSTQNASVIPFSIRRVFIICDVQADTLRGKHAHKKTKQAMFCIQGSVHVRLSDGKKKRVYRLTDPRRGIFIDRLVWSEMYNFSSDAILMVFASDYYKEGDYIRDYRNFLKLIK